MEPGWRRVGQDRWALFYGPKKPGARWVKKEDGQWLPQYSSALVNEVALAIAIAAISHVIPGFEYKIAKRRCFPEKLGVPPELWASYHSPDVHDIFRYDEMHEKLRQIEVFEVARMSQPVALALSRFVNEYEHDADEYEEQE